MKREIEFRAISIETQDYVYGQLFYSHSTGVWKITCSNGWIPSYSNPDEGEITIFHDIDHKTIGQYTGQKDKKGFKVFEGDILENTQGRTGIITFEDAAFSLKTNRDNNTTWIIPLSVGFLKNKTIIGNIHQNKELLQ